MSRIHEALKKAEQDRSASLVDRKIAEQPPLINPRQTAQIAATTEVVLTPLPPPVTPELKPRADSDTLPLNELLTKCAKTNWKLDPNFLVFSSTSDFPTGAEQ